MLKELAAKAGCRMIPCLDRDFIPAVLWDREFRKAVAASGRARRIVIALERTPESVSTFETVVFADPDAEERAANIRHVERLVKGMLWMRGGWKITIAGDAGVAADLAKIYAPGGERAFDFEMMP